MLLGTSQSHIENCESGILTGNDKKKGKAALASTLIFIASILEVKSNPGVDHF